MISSHDGIDIPENEMVRALEQANHTVKEIVWTGWSMFYPFSPPEIAPSFHPELEDRTGPSVLVSNLLDDVVTGLPDYWRFSVYGRATILRPFREDRQRFVERIGRQPGTWLTPETIVRETTEVVTHARIIADAFGGEEVSFRCSWNGLNNRTLRDFDGTVWSENWVCKAPQRTTTGTWDLAALKANWQQVVAELSCPILSLFGYPYCNFETVAAMIPRFVKLR